MYLSTEMSASVTGVIRLKLSVIVISHVLEVWVQSAMKSLVPCETTAVHFFPFEHKNWLIVELVKVATHYWEFRPQKMRHSVTPLQMASQSTLFWQLFTHLAVELLFGKSAVQFRRLCRHGGSALVMS